MLAAILNQKNMNLQRKIILFSICSVFTFSCNDKKNKIESPKEQAQTFEVYKQPIIVDIISIIRKPPEELRRIFGEPSKVERKPKDCADLHNCNLEVQYKKGGITVLFNNNKALWFDFENLDSLKFSNMSTIFGLENRVPKQFGNDVGNDVMWYENYPGIERIAFIESKSKPGFIDYAIVTVEK